MGNSTQFEDLKVYQDAVDFTVTMYKLLDNSQFKYEFGIADQLKRASLSISNNIAEGFERQTDKEYIRFLYFSKGSVGEVRNLLFILRKLNLIDALEFEKRRESVVGISKQLSNYIKFIKKRSGNTAV